MKNNLYTISAHLAFADTLAEWVLERFGSGSLLLPRLLILLPSRRATQSLREAFLRATGGTPLLLPRIETLGDADEDTLLLTQAPLAENMPEESFAYHRLFLLSRLVQQHQSRILGEFLHMDHAMKLASELARLMDECEREEVALEKIMSIVPDAFALHWQKTVEFLSILFEHWPGIAVEEGLVSPGAHQSRVLRELAKEWRAIPPSYPVIAAGTTGSIPATAELLKAIAGLPQGFIVLPGLDRDSDDAYFAHLEEGHPQWGMAQLLLKLKADRKDVQAIGEAANARVRLMAEVMRPAAVSDAWRDFKRASPLPTGGKEREESPALQGLFRLNCASLQEEATACALLLRETLEQPGRTAALVTHHRGLARRVAGIMHRFGVTIDDSAGLPLKQTPLAAFLRLLLVAAANGLAPLPLLSLLKHPLAVAGMERGECLEAARQLERLVLRGLRRTGGIEGLRQALLKKKEVPPSVHPLLDALQNAFAPLLALLAKKETALAECIDTHLACARALGTEEMWSGQEAEAVSECLWLAQQASNKALLAVDPASYPGMFDELLSGKVVRPEYGMHPRLRILSPMEARMQSFDRTILGGLNEGSWPEAPKSDPWFSRPMRAALGLPSPERRLGLAGHDFFMLACAPEVYLTRAAKEGGAPALPSRWLTKLEMLAGELSSRDEIIFWAQGLDAPEYPVPMRPPAPTPPLSARPVSLSVTQVETWMRDPYAVYAAKILGLYALDPLGREPAAFDFGNAVHDALEKFVQAHPGPLPKDALPQLLKLGREAFAELFAATGMEILWWPRFARIAEWIIAVTEERGAQEVLAEQEGSLAYDGFTLKGRADRLEKSPDGSLAIVDYKTGGVPAPKDIKNGLSSQLVLLALIARAGGFAEISSHLGGERGAIFLEYWQLRGGDSPADVTRIDPKKMQEYISEAEQGLRALIARYRDPSFPYRSVPVPSRASRYSDYVHLARIKEWG